MLGCCLFGISEFYFFTSSSRILLFGEPYHDDRVVPPRSRVSNPLGGSAGGAHRPDHLPQIAKLEKVIRGPHSANDTRKKVELGALSC